MPANTNQALAIIKLEWNEKIDHNYVALILSSKVISEKIGGLQVGVAQQNLSLTQIADFEIPLPPLEVQRQFVDEFEDEKKIINANKQLVDIMSKKINQILSEIWSS